MSRRMMIAGNWKLNTTLSEALALADALAKELAAVEDCDLVVAPPYISLGAVSQRLENTPLAVAGQDLFHEDQGAFTGAISGPMLRSVGCTYVLVGHSERRQFFGETLKTSQCRVQAALRARLIPILCVGETLEEREAGRTTAVVTEQLDAGLAAVSDEDMKSVVVAYEPVWAIGTGKVATPEQAQEVHAVIRSRLQERSTAVAESLRILYGGSVKPDNADALLAQPDIDGALVGGASLKVDSFVAIVAARPSAA